MAYICCLYGGYGTDMAGVVLREETNFDLGGAQRIGKLQVLWVGMV